MIKSFKIFEAKIKWYSKGKFEEDSNTYLDILDDRILKIGDKIKMVNRRNARYYNNKFQNSEYGDGENIDGHVSNIIEIENGIKCVVLNSGSIYNINNIEKVEEGVKWYKKGKFEDDPNLPETTEYNDFITNDEFREFLIDNEAYDEFIKYCNKNRNIFSKVWGERGFSIINICLHWASTPSGSKFWSKLNNKWNGIIKNRGL
jgi:hypothetical protein